ncbi:Protein of unknown function (DUF3054) [Thermosporothrix hazakensis]|jgi:hypothetical protein|uniref:DUF3054 family protein n=2 Tax=Thermosporothrix TaxID=768650 RepID=A0A326U1U1_THEHA|nr:DUF3054 domain-containing protein [Thermosporothrix hazakensis]PZW23925.1 Protein of unknown function (DUF3054) [Thermosporothrix hazakensis]BBH90439.1 hypothetical protein KTC_51900 [Thermosporothrix sp. COM3]GCE48476.1 hypothetical protein KTH_33450 [Thermosporothrix hazakensis]
MAVKESGVHNAPAISSGRKARGGRIFGLAVGDLLVFLIIGAIGLQMHQKEINAENMLRVTWPLAVAWFVISPFLGVFSRKTERRPGQMAARTGIAWLLACAGAMGLRQVFITPVEVSFAIVTFLTNLVGLYIWRLPFSWVIRSKEKSAD